MDMSKRDPKAPAKTTIRGWRIARMAAIKKVLSPISENMIIMNERTSTSAEASERDVKGVVVDICKIRLLENVDEEGGRKGLLTLPASL